LTRGERRSSIAGPAGALEVALNVPEGSVRGIALIAHPHPLQGGTLDNKVVQTLAKTFAALGYAATRFNFRGVGLSEGRFDDGIGETDDALAALADQSARPVTKRLLSQIRERVREGTSLGDALAAHPETFSDLYIGMVRAGEAAGGGVSSTGGLQVVTATSAARADE